eukprot:scaffold294_cov221-Amphora_coffeaeformis.AAC.4
MTEQLGTSSSTTILGKFLGVWDLVSFHAQAADGTRTYPHGPHSWGQLMYTADGYMSAHLSRQDKPAVKNANPVIGDQLAYTGTFDVDVTAHTVTHHVHCFCSSSGLPEMECSPDNPAYFTRDYQFGTNEHGVDTLLLSLVYYDQSKMDLLWARKKPYPHGTMPVKEREFRDTRVSVRYCKGVLTTRISGPGATTSDEISLCSKFTKRRSRFPSLRTREQKVVMIFAHKVPPLPRAAEAATTARNTTRATLLLVVETHKQHPHYHPATTPLLLLSAFYPNRFLESFPMSSPPVFVQVKRRKQIFAFLLDGNSTIADVKSKISAVAEQHDIPEAAEESRLLLDGKPCADDTTLASVVADGSNKGAASEGLSFDLIYAIADNEYEPVEIEPTRATA